MSEAEARRLWFLAPEGLPVRGDARWIPPGSTHQCLEGDDVWTPLMPRGAIVGPRTVRGVVPTPSVDPGPSWAILEACE